KLSLDSASLKEKPPAVRGFFFFIEDFGGIFIAQANLLALDNNGGYVRRFYPTDGASLGFDHIPQRRCSCGLNHWNQFLSARQLHHLVGPVLTPRIKYGLIRL